MEDVYSTHLLERHLQDGPSLSTTSGRSAFQRDRDRVLYSSAFRALALKTQVVAATELGFLHNRLTHSIKVAQVGRSMASRLHGGGAAIDPDLVEAACYAHDIGHPPFGHAGEMALNAAVEKHRRVQLHLQEDAQPDPPLDGFEGNAQNLRVLTRLSSHRQWESPGLHLTRVTLCAATKYPWLRGTDERSHEKWGAYAGDAAALDWMLTDRPQDVARPVEADLMDWADDITYAVHDVEDWFRVRRIPLDQLFRFSVAPDHPNSGRDENQELSDFLDSLEGNQKKFPGFDRPATVKMLHILADKISVQEPYGGTRRDKGRLQATVTDLITYFADVVTFDGVCAAYQGQINIPDDQRHLCDVLKQLVWHYVIKRPSLAAQQHGQTRIVDDLVDWLHEDPERLLPEDRKAEWHEHGDLTRTVADHVATLTEPMAVALHGKLSGSQLGWITDTV